MRNRYLSLIIVSLTLLTIFLTNFDPRSWLIGWDNLIPEINIWLNLKRSFFAIWQEYRGLGLLDGMGHATEVVRQIVLLPSVLILPNNLIRYFWNFLMLVLGTFGTYRALTNLTKSSKSQQILGSLFYLLNFGTIQYFWLPHDSFITFWGLFPWLILSFIQLLKKSTKKAWLFFVLINFLVIPGFYIPTLFLVYGICLLVIALSHSGLNKKIVKPLIIVFLINVFWLLPFVYFTTINRNQPQDAYINLMSTEETFFRNLKRGTVNDFLLLRGYYFDFPDGSESIMKSWVNYQSNTSIVGLGYTLGIITLLGLITAPNWLRLLFLLSATALLSATQPFSWINDFFRHSGLFSQVFRSPFTKFIVPAAFSFSFLIVHGAGLLVKILKKRFLTIFVCPILIFFLLSFSFPVFQGKLINPNLRIKIPQEYFQLFRFFKQQPKNTRIANFPQQTYWGWNKYQWDYSGSGFLWYGIEQPLLDRAFDPWSDKNENYYWEISYALYSKNQELFEKVLEKYQINWLLVDGNVINPSSPKALYFDELEEMISKSNKISLAQEFNKIKIYQVALETPVKDFVFLAQNLPQIEPQYNWNNYDQAYFENGSFFSGSTPEIFYPFRSLFSGRAQEDLEFKVEDRGDYFLFKNEVSNTTQNYQLIIPGEESKELIYVETNNLSDFQFLQPEVNFDGMEITAKVPKVSGLYSAEIEPTKNKDLGESVNCQEYLGGQVENEIIKDGGNQFIRLKATDAKNCGTSFSLPNLNHQLSYLITIEARHVEGKSLLFWIENFNSRKADLETYFPKTKKWQKFIFIQPPMEEDGLGYSLHFDNISIGKIESVNDLGKITINPFPFKFLTSLKLVNPDTQPRATKLYEPEEVYHPNPSYYQIRSPLTDHQSPEILVLSQAYHDGWLAWEGNPFVGKKLEHILVNNWQNGWILPDHQSPNTDHLSPITILFWPQLLEYFGFFLLITTLMGVGVYYLKKSRNYLLKLKISSSLKP